MIWNQTFLRYHCGRAARRMLVVCAAAICILASNSFAVAEKSIPEEIEWAWYARPVHPNATLPNVLLLGDSICRNYYPRVTEQLAGVANVYLLATSASIGDPRLLAQIREFERLEAVPFAVVHFNNGMHGWDYSEMQYRLAFPAFLRAVRKIGKGHAVLIWTSTTPVKIDKPERASNDRIAARNAIALSALERQNIAVDDQHALMIQHQNLYADTVHYNAAGSEIQGDQAAVVIRNALKVRK